MIELKKTPHGVEMKVFTSYAVTIVKLSDRDIEDMARQIAELTPKSEPEWQWLYESGYWYLRNNNGVARTMVIFNSLTELWCWSGDYRLSFGTFAEAINHVELAVTGKTGWPHDKCERWGQ